MERVPKPSEEIPKTTINIETIKNKTPQKRPHTTRSYRKTTTNKTLPNTTKTTTNKLLTNYQKLQTTTNETFKKLPQATKSYQQLRKQTRYPKKGPSLCDAMRSVDGHRCSPGLDAGRSMWHFVTGQCRCLYENNHQNMANYMTLSTSFPKSAVW